MDDAGSAVVEHLFAMVLVAAIGLGLIQVAVTVHVHHTLTACASEGARVAARQDALDHAAERAESCARSAVAVEATATVERVPVDGLAGIRVTLAGPAPVLGVWRVGGMEATARAIDEAALGAP